MKYTYGIEVHQYAAYKNKWQWMDVSDIHKASCEEDAIDSVQELSTDGFEPGSYRLYVKECNIEGEDVVFEKLFQRKTLTVWS